MKNPEFTIKQIRDFVSKGYQSVSARYVEAALMYIDQLTNDLHCNCEADKKNGRNAGELLQSMRQTGQGVLGKR